MDLEKISMERINILAVLPYEGVKEIIINAAKKRPKISLHTCVGDLKEGIEAARKEISSAYYDIIISRGGTAELMRKEFPDYIVLDIETSFEDILQTMRLAKNYQEKFAVVCFPSISARARALCDLLQYNVEVQTLFSEEEVKPALKRMQSEGYTMVVGDVITTRIAKSIGMNTILLTSGRESVESALDQAEMIFSVRNNSGLERSRLQWLLKTMPLWATIFDENGEIIVTNVENGEDSKVYYALIKKLFRKMKDNPTAHFDRQVGKRIYSMDSVSRLSDGKTEVAVYGRSIFHEILVDRGGVSLPSGNDDESYVFEAHVGMSSSVGKTHEMIMKYSESSLPVLLMGEPGTGKDTAAQMIHKNGRDSGKPYYIIDCALVTDREWHELLENPSSPLSSVNCTVYFKNIQDISQANERKLRNIIEQTNLCKRNRVIFSATIADGEQQCPMSKFLLDETGCLLLQSLPLRRRTEDISSLAVIYISNLNSELGKQIIGFQAGAEDLLLKFPWPGNVAQFKRVLRELVLSTDGYYITPESVSGCLQNEVFSSDSESAPNINLNQTLDEITYDVVKMVLKQQNMNHKKTAELLNISRSTIWRILKNHE